MTVDGRRFVLLGLLVLAVLGVCASTFWAWLLPGFSFEPVPLTRQERLDEALAAGLGAGLLVLGALPMYLLRPPWWLALVHVALVALLGLLGLHALGAAAHAPTHHAAEDAPMLTVQHFLYAPTTWPMLLFVVVTPVLRARSRLGRRSAPAR